MAKKISFEVEVDETKPIINKFELKDDDLLKITGGADYTFVEEQRESMIVQYGLNEEQAALFRSIPSYDLMMVFMSITLACAVNHGEYTVAQIIEETCKAYFNNK